MMLQNSIVEYPPPAPERRGHGRIPCHSHAMVAALGLDSFGPYGEDLLLEVCTKDVSITGARIVAPNLLTVGQSVLFRMEVSPGCAVSANAVVTYKGCRGPDEKGTKCDWGLCFDHRDVDAFRHYGVFDRALNHHVGSVDEVAMLVSNRPLELLWWFVRLPHSVRTVFVGTDDEQVIERMQKMAPPHRTVRSLMS